MRFFLDHDVPAEVGRVLRNEQHDVVELRDAMDVKSSDEEVFTYAAKAKRILITCNRDDFLALAAAHAHHGLVILVRRQTRHAECAHVLALLDRAGEAGLAGNVNFA